MKKVITIILIYTLFEFVKVSAQTPQAIKYQAIARDLGGNIISNQNVSFRISILQGSTTGPSMYTETQTATTNQFGLTNLSVGMGTVVTGNFSSINWGNNTYFVKMEFDAAGGSNYALMGTSQLLSVPYALYSESTGDTSMWKKTQSGIYYNGNIGIGVIPHLADVSIDVAGGYIQIGKDSAGQQGLVKNVPLNTSGYDGSLLLGFDPGYGTLELHHQLGGYGGGNTSSNFYTTFNTTEGGVSSGERMRIAPNGNIGIGTTSPQQTFHVYKSSGQWETAELETNQPNTALLFGGLNGTSYIGQSGSGFAIAASHPYWSNPHLYIDSLGRVGLGTNTPVAKLQVSGGDVFVDAVASGIIIKSPNGNCWRVTIDNSGNLVRTAIACP